MASWHPGAARSRGSHWKTDPTRHAIGHLVIADCGVHSQPGRRNANTSVTGVLCLAQFRCAYHPVPALAAHSPACAARISKSPLRAIRQTHGADTITVSPTLVQIRILPAGA